MFKIWLAFLVLIGPSLGAAQSRDGQVLSPAEMQLTAFGALQDGNAARALALAEALLIRDENDPVALRIAAQAALTIGQSEAAERHSRTLFHQADDDTGRYLAARLMALALVQQDRFTAAQFWLRRARQSAPDAASAQSAASDFIAVRQRNPLSFSLDFGIQPSSNVNNGSSEQTISIAFGSDAIIVLPLSASQQDLSGFFVSAGAELQYRVAETPNSFTTANFALQTSQTILSSKSRTDAPNFDASSLSSWRVDTGMSHTWAVGPSNLPANASLNYGLTFYDGEILASDLQFSLARRWRTGERASLTTNLTLGQTRYRETGILANTWSAQADWRHVLDNSHVLSLNAEVGRSRSDAARFAFSWQSIGASYDIGRIVDRFDVAFAGTYTERTYGSSSGGTVTREDERTHLSLAVGLPTVEYYGFTPTVTFAAEQNNSTSARFQTEAITVDLGFRSSF